MRKFNKWETGLVLDEMVWSYSRINSYHTCKRMFYLTYITSVDRRNNFFGQYGSFVHEILEMYGKDKLKLEDIVSYYEDNFDKYITEKAPPNKYVDLRDSYYKKGKKYLDKFDGFANEVVAIEKELKFIIELSNRKITFTGFIDKIEKCEGEFEIIDYKSKSDFVSEEEYKHYLIQLYLYSIGVKICYDKYPSKLTFDMFKIDKVIEHDFVLEEMESAKKWVEDTLNDIYIDETFEKKSNKTYDDFFCKYICGVGNAKCGTYDKIFEVMN